MKRNLVLPLAIMFLVVKLHAQTEPSAGHWKTWFISSGKDYRFHRRLHIKMKLQRCFLPRETWIRGVSSRSNTGTRVRRVTIGKI